METNNCIKVNEPVKKVGEDDNVKETNSEKYKNVICCDMSCYTDSILFRSLERQYGILSLCNEPNLNGNSNIIFTKNNNSFDCSKYVVDNSPTLCIESSSCQDLTGKDIPNIDELIKLVVNQTMCSELAARKALITCEGDVICAILKVTD